MKKRDVILLNTKRYTRRGTEKKRYKVPFRGVYRKGSKYFDKKSDANRFAKIKYRFISKYAWLAGAENLLKKPLKSGMPKVGAAVKRLKKQIGLYKTSYHTNYPFVRLTNAVYNISRYANVAAKVAIDRTQNRITRSSNKKRVKKNYKKLWGK